MFNTNIYQQMNRPNFSTPFLLSFSSTYHSVRQRLYNSYWFNFQLTQNTTYSKHDYIHSANLTITPILYLDPHFALWFTKFTNLFNLVQCIKINIEKSVELLWNYRYFHNTKILIHPISSPLEVICQESWYLHFMVPISCRT